MPRVEGVCGDASRELFGVPLGPLGRPGSKRESRPLQSPPTWRQCGASCDEGA